MRFHNLARFADIGSNSYLVEIGSTRIVLDAGTHPKHTGRDTLPLFETIEQDSVDGILISHPHLDHIGGLPVLMQQQVSAAVAMTPETRESGSALLHNSVNVMKSQRDELDEPDYPLYSHRKVDELERLWFTRSPGEVFSLGEVDRVQCEFYRAGHVLGAVGVHLQGENESVFYTGDVHFEDQTMTRKAEFPEESFDTLIIFLRQGSIFQLGWVFVGGVGFIGSVALKNALNSLCRVTPCFPNTSWHKFEPLTGSSYVLLNFISICGDGEML